MSRIALAFVLFLGVMRGMQLEEDDNFALFTVNSGDNKKTPFLYFHFSVNVDKIINFKTRDLVFEISFQNDEFTSLPSDFLCEKVDFSNPV